MRDIRFFRGACALFTLALVFGESISAGADQRVIVKAKKPYTAVKQRIIALGGNVTYEFENADGLAATVPDSQLNAVKAIAGIDYVVEDRILPDPSPRARRDVAEAFLTDLPLDSRAARTRSRDSRHAASGSPTT